VHIDPGKAQPNKLIIFGDYAVPLSYALAYLFIVVILFSYMYSTQLFDKLKLIFLLFYKHGLVNFPKLISITSKFNFRRFKLITFRSWLLLIEYLSQLDTIPSLTYKVSYLIKLDSTSNDIDCVYSVITLLRLKGYYCILYPICRDCFIVGFVGEEDLENFYSLYSEAKLLLNTIKTLPIKYTDLVRVKDLVKFISVNSVSNKVNRLVKVINYIFYTLDEAKLNTYLVKKPIAINFHKMHSLSATHSSAILRFTKRQDKSIQVPFPLNISSVYDLDIFICDSLGIPRIYNAINSMLYCIEMTQQNAFLSLPESKLILDLLISKDIDFNSSYIMIDI
jgi:hypothetical protein